MTFDARDLAAEFDASFARAYPVPRPHADVLALAIGGDGYALRVADIAGVFIDRAIAGVPTRRADVLGVASFRGAILPVFDLAVVLGYTSATAPRWLAVTAAAPIAFAFERFDGHLRIPTDAFGRQEAAAHPHVREVIATDTHQLSVIDLASVLTAITARDTP